MGVERGMAISETTYEQVALEDGDEFWELECGHLRPKPPMTLDHDYAMRTLMLDLVTQLDRRQFSVFMNGPRLRISSGTFYVPDIAVVPLDLLRRFRAERGIQGRH